MSDETPSTPRRRFGKFGRDEEAIVPWEQAREQEAAAGLALLAERRRSERFERRLKQLLAMWPVGVGIILAVFSPMLLDLAKSWGAWGPTLIFPFVVLADRPELQAGPITHFLPAIMLYAQFPIEGLLARIILRRPVLPLSVTVQVLLFHFLGIVEVWMLNGSGAPPALGR